MRFVVFVAILTLVLARPSLAHKEWVHQYIVKQSYLLLESQVGQIPELRDRMGLEFFGKGDDIDPRGN